MSFIEYKEYKQKFRFVSKLGNGNCASVMLIQDIQTKKPYALKYCKFDSADKLACAFQEIEVIRAIDHSTAIQVLYYFCRTQHGAHFTPAVIEMAMVMELGDRSLEQDINLRKKKDRYYTLEEIQKLLKTLVEFFAHMQRKRYMHRDIKPDNILLMPQEGVYKVCDFGFSVREHEFSDKNIAGTAGYASPKIQHKFKNSNIFVNGNNYKDDIYSLGITIIEVCSLTTCEPTNPTQFLPKITARYGTKLAALIHTMVEFDERLRPDFLEMSAALEKYFRSKSVSNPGLSPQVDKIPVKAAKPEVTHLPAARPKTIERVDQYIEIFTEPPTADSENYHNTKPKPSIDRGIPQTDRKTRKQIEYQNLHEMRGQERQQKQKQNEKNLTPTSKKNRSKAKKSPLNSRAISTSSNAEVQIKTDKIKTKRKSKAFPNNSTVDYKQINKTTKNTLHSYKNLLAKKSGGNPEPRQVQASPQKQKAKHEQIIYQNVTKLYTLHDDSEVTHVQIIQMPSSEEITYRIALCFIFSQKLYICSEIRQGCHSIIRIKFEAQLIEPKLMLYCRKLQRLFLICPDNTIKILSLANLPRVIQHCQAHDIAKIDATELQLIEWNTNTIDLACVEVGSRQGQVIKSFKNGDVAVDSQLVLPKCRNATINYIKKHKDFLYLCNYQGYITKHYAKLHALPDNSNNLLASHICNSTIIALQTFESGSRSGLVAVTATGVAIYLDFNLRLLEKCVISRQCLRVCSVDFGCRQGRRIVCVDVNGRVYNENSEVICDSGITDCESLFMTEDQQSAILLTQSKAVISVDLRPAPAAKNGHKGYICQSIPRNQTSSPAGKGCDQ